MTTLEQARAWFATTAGTSLVADIDNDCDTALAEQARIVGRMGAYPGSVLTEARRAATELERAQDGFNAAVNMIVQGRARDGRQVLAAYRAYVAALLRLQGLNARNDAFVAAGVAEALANLFAAGAQVMSGRIRRETQGMIRDLERIQSSLTRARRIVVTSQGLRALNAILSVLGGVLGAITRFQRIAMAIEVGGTILTTALEASMGPSSPSELDLGRSGLDNLVEAAEDLNPVISGLHQVSSALMDLMSDSERVGAAQADLERVQRELDAAERTFRAYNRHVGSAMTEVTLTKRLAQGAVRDARSRARAYREAAADYREVDRMLTEIE